MTEENTLGNGQVIEAYIRYKRLDWRRAATVSDKRRALYRLSEAIPNLVGATEADLLAWCDSIPGSIDNVASQISLVRGLYEWLSAIQKTRLDNPAAILRRPRLAKRKPRPMLDPHYDLALACALSDPEMYLWLGLMGCSGFRCCEVAWARTMDFEPQSDGSGIARIIGKGGKRRPIPVGSMIMLTLRPFLVGSGYVFTRPSGKPWSPKRVSEKTSAFLKSINIPETAHAMRHRFGTDYHALDPDLYRQALLMGHESVDTTQLYTEVDPIEAAQYIERLTRSRLTKPDLRRAG